MRISRSCTPRNAPYVWEEFLDHSHGSVVHFSGWLQGLPSGVREDVIARIHASESLAAKGLLKRGGPTVVEPVESYDDMWEMKWTVYEPGSGKNREIRQYHAEPVSSPKAFVRLHRHVKRVNLPNMIRQLQQKEMAFAKRRFDIWLGVESTTP